MLTLASQNGSEPSRTLSKCSVKHSNPFHSIPEPIARPFQNVPSCNVNDCVPGTVLGNAVTPTTLPHFHSSSMHRWRRLVLYEKQLVWQRQQKDWFNRLNLNADKECTRRLQIIQSLQCEHGVTSRLGQAAQSHKVGQLKRSYGWKILVSMSTINWKRKIIHSRIHYKIQANLMIQQDNSEAYGVNGMKVYQKTAETMHSWVKKNWTTFTYREFTRTHAHTHTHTHTQSLPKLGLFILQTKKTWFSY